MANRGEAIVAKFIYALNVSLDGYVDHDKFMPDPKLFQHFIKDVSQMTATIYGRRMYEIMRYWDDEQPGWDQAERDYAAVWRRGAKYVVSTTLDAVGPNATLIRSDFESRIRALKEELSGNVEVSGPKFAASLSAWGLIDEYRLYVHPVVLGEGAPYFAGVRPSLKLVAHERIGDVAIRLSYVPA
jgi:dihydrofolate reductase